MQMSCLIELINLVDLQTQNKAYLPMDEIEETYMSMIWKSHNIPISTKIRLMKALVWPVATYGCESLTLRKNAETRLDAFEMKGLRRMLRVSWTATKTNVDIILDTLAVYCDI